LTLLIRKADRCAPGAGFPTALLERYINQTGITLRGGRPCTSAPATHLWNQVLASSERRKNWPWHCTERSLDSPRTRLW